jgi:hypothetical protein
MIIDFVNLLGGGLLMLGGRQAFAEGGYGNSVLQHISPLVMADEAQPAFSRSIKIEPSEAALVPPALMLADTHDQSLARW